MILFLPFPDGIVSVDQTFVRFGRVSLGTFLVEVVHCVVFPIANELIVWVVWTVVLEPFNVRMPIGFEQEVHFLNGHTDIATMDIERIPTRCR